MTREIRHRETLARATAATVLVAVSCAVVCVHAATLVSRPAGYMKVRLAPGSQRLVALPFEAFDNSIEAVLGNQLTAAADEEFGDRVLKWDQASQCYIGAVRLGPDRFGPWAGVTEAAWYTDEKGTARSGMTFEPGEGFWLQNRQSEEEEVMLAGEVVLRETVAISFYPVLNLFSTPFLSPSALNEAGLVEAGAAGGDTIEQADVVAGWDAKDPFGGKYKRWWLLSKDGDARDGKWVDVEEGEEAGDVLKPGTGYWYHRKFAPGFVWEVDRPYEDLFPSDEEALPRIEGIGKDEKGNAVVQIAVDGAAGLVLEIYIQDILDSKGFLARKAWRVGATALQTAGRDRITWTDTVPAEPGKPEPLGRCYLTAISGIDTDGDGLGDAYEEFILQTNPLKADSDGDGLGDAEELAQGTSPSDPKSKRVLYVDQAIGSDAYTGRFKSVSGVDGPKKTINAALEISEPGDVIRVSGGVYKENVFLWGKDVKLISDGKVRLAH